jgi:hypothetical protein
MGEMLGDPTVQIWMLHVFALVLMPSAITAAAGIQSQRLSLLTVLFSS